MLFEFQTQTSIDSNVNSGGRTLGRGTLGRGTLGRERKTRVDSRSGDLHRVDSRSGASLLYTNYSEKGDTPRVDSRSGAGEPVM